MDRTQLRDVLAGRKRGAAASLVRLIASCGEPFYYAGAAWKNRGYDRDPRRAVRVGVPVISVGNITVGGTGKTPMVEWITRRLLERGKRVGLISRGYGARRGQANDEAMELAQKLPGVPHLQNPDRVAAARRAIEEHGCEVLVLDDAFQHRRIARDLDLVLIDATDPFGGGHLLPRGLLRESLAGLRRASAVVLSRADAIEAPERDRIWQTLHDYAPHVPRIEAAHAPAALVAVDGSTEELNRLQGRRVAAFCGIGNPAAFRATLEACGAEIAAFRAYPDHFAYDASQIETLAAWIAGLDGVEQVICTHKDLVKVAENELAGKRLFALSIGIRFLQGEQTLLKSVETSIL